MTARASTDADVTGRSSSGAVDAALVGVLEETLRYARERDYRGPDYSDGLSSRLLRALPVENRWLNLAVQESVKRSPVDLRPLFLVEERRNYKGTALFSMANATLDSLLADDDAAPRYPVDYADEAAALADWLVDQRCVGYRGFCGGHRHEIQHFHTKGVPNDPDVVSTSYAVKALLGSELGDRHAETARTAERFLVEDLDYRGVDDGAIINYHLNHADDVYTPNAGAIGARLLVDLYDRFGDERLRDRARALLDYIATHQADVGGWTYRIPAETSHLSMDNHHNGFIVECFLRYRDAVGSSRYDDVIDDALRFYREVLFDRDGAPNFDESAAYPRDIHASAQGIIVFSYAGERDVARRILDWTLENLYAGEGRFYYRKHRYFTNKITLMRWCQAWMAYAVAEHLRTGRSDAALSPTATVGR